MRTIKQAGEYELEVKKSRFLCALQRVSTEDEARDFILQRRKLHHEARHNCSSFVDGDDGRVQKCSDDGGPAGTAGIQMLERRRRDEGTNGARAVSRCLGRVLLGQRGLVPAFSTPV